MFEDKFIQGFEGGDSSVQEICTIRIENGWATKFFEDAARGRAPTLMFMTFVDNFPACRQLEALPFLDPLKHFRGALFYYQRKKDNTLLNNNATFLEDLKDHIDEFIHASMDEHKTCFKKTIQKMFGMSKAIAERSAAEAKEAGVESALPLQTSVSQ
uniref:Uncharacterized protein n=1 Tax=Zea mays TaxID=4577 RepID=A0A804NHW9_MAIZE